MMFIENEKYELNKAAQKGDFQQVKNLIEVKRIPANSTTPEILCTNGYTVNGSTALHQAAQNLHVEIVEYLLRLKVDPNVVTKGEEWTPLHAVAVNSLSRALSDEENRRAIKVIQLLLSAGADINKEVIAFGVAYTALDLARKWNKQALIPTLTKALSEKPFNPAVVNQLAPIPTLMAPLQNYLVYLLQDLFSKYHLRKDSYNILIMEIAHDLVIRGKIINDANGCMETYADAPSYMYSILTRIPRDILQFRVGPGVHSRFSGIYSGAGASIKAVNLTLFEEYVKNLKEQKQDPKYFDKQGRLTHKEYILRESSLGGYVFEKKEKVEDDKNYVYQAFLNSKQRMFKTTVQKIKLDFVKSDYNFSSKIKHPQYSALTKAPDANP